MKPVILLVALATLLEAEDNPGFEPGFIVPARSHYLPNAKVGPIRSPQALEVEGRKHEGVIDADVELVLILERPRKLARAQTDALQAELEANSDSARETLSNMPLVGPNRTFVLLDSDGAARAIVFDYLSAFQVTGLRYLSDGIVQTDRSFLRSIDGPAILEITGGFEVEQGATAPLGLDGSTKTPFEEWRAWWEEKGKWQARTERAAARREKQEAEKVEGSDP